MTTLAASPPSVRARAGLLRSTIGRKAVMAVTGVILVGFVIAHLVGNLQLYLGRAAMNHYAEFLRAFLHGGGLWLARAVLLASVGLHIWAATTLTLEARAARPVAYRRWEPEESTIASRTMRWSGYLLAGFILYHLLHLTTGQTHPDFVPGDVYRNVVEGFRRPAASALYIAAMVLLGLHLSHGIWSLFRTLGVGHPRAVRFVKLLARVIAVLVTVGNISFPLAVLAGIVQ